ncbi:hypothetical protein GGI01_002382 [Coemansia sp. RSA 376]|nr:hypothetical protein H4S03_001316 [Coemansia sp. S3946]KAJ2052781.1 hypothetical protein H4S04_001107 [Coemansia sp. S16]KAJ2104648.1 hypothetical protein IW146_008588 [Coemansia sp. RSA 922]KAJ2261316.1 hypothetical protein GGI01_002382 [Coemansia sp. RSA 376]
MAFAPAQPVGGRMRFPPPQLGQSSASPFTPVGMRERAEFMTPTRQVGGNGANVTSSPFRTSLRHSAYFEAESNVNPFTPRVERGVSAGTSSRTLGRRGPSLNTDTARGVRDYGLGSVDGSATGLDALAMNGDFASMGGGVGAWPMDPGSSGINGSGMDTTIKSPFGSRPKSPGQRSASPRRRTKLPSFLLGSAQLSRSPAKSSAQGSELAPSYASASMYGMASPKAQTPITANPISPRRLSRFGSNDMLSSSHTSAILPGHKGAAPVLDDAPPVLSLDDMDLDHDDPFVRASDGDAGQFGSTNGGAKYTDTRNSEDGEPSSEEDYNDIKIRSIIIRGLPADTESSALSYFRGFGEILTFAVVPPGGLAILYEHPWQAQRAVGQADIYGRIMIGDRTIASIASADEACVAALFAKAFPDKELPRSAIPPAMDSFSLAETLYAQSPQPRGVRQPLQQQQQRVGSRLSALQADDVRGRSEGASSPFKQNQSLYTRNVGDESGAQNSSGTVYSPASILRVAPTPKPRNGFLQSAMDILFGW